MKTSNFSQNIQKAIAFMFAATFAVSFTACTDDLMTDNNKKEAKEEDEVVEYGWDAVKAKLVSIYPDIYSEHVKEFVGAFNLAKNWMEDKYCTYPTFKVNTGHEYFDEVNEKFIEMLRKKKGIDIEIRK